MTEYAEDETGIAGIQYAGARYARAVAEAVEQEMKDLCPVDTGRLSASIRTEAVGETTYVYVGTEYWSYVEFGTSRMAAQPFIRPALNRRHGVVGFTEGI